MKKLLSLFCLILSLGVNSYTFSQSIQERLIGKWHLISKSGGITGKSILIEKKTVLEFSSDCKYKSYEEDSLKYTSTYSLHKNLLSHYKRDSINILQIDRRFFGKYEMYFRNKNMVLREPYPDGFTRIYRRVPPSSSIK